MATRYQLNQKSTNHMNSNQKKKDNQTDGDDVRQIDEALVGIIRGMGFLVNNAKKSNLKSVYQILSIAREDIIIWAANFDKQLPEIERHKQELLFDTGLLVALDFISKHASTENIELKNQMQENLEILKRSGINISSKSFS